MIKFNWVLTWAISNASTGSSVIFNPVIHNSRVIDNVLKQIFGKITIYIRGIIHTLYYIYHNTQETFLFLMNTLLPVKNSNRKERYH